MEERSALSNLSSYVNGRGEEAVNRRVVEETTRLERLKDRGEVWHMGALTIQRNSSMPRYYLIRLANTPQDQLPPFSLLRDFSFQNTSEHFAIRFRQSYLIWKVCDVTAIEMSSKE